MNAVLPYGPLLGVATQWLNPPLSDHSNPIPECHTPMCPCRLTIWSSLSLMRAGPMATQRLGFDPPLLSTLHKVCDSARRFCNLINIRKECKMSARPITRYVGAKKVIMPIVGGDDAKQLTSLLPLLRVRWQRFAIIAPPVLSFKQTLLQR